MSRSLPVATLGLFLVLSPARAAVDFDKDVRPLLEASCFKCHSGNDSKPNAKPFQMDLAEEFAKRIGPGGYVIPGDPDASEMFHRIRLDDKSLPREDQMPPPRRGVKALDEDQVAVILQWIKEGAKIGPASAPMTAASAPAAGAPDPKALHQWKGVSGTSFSAYFVKIDGTNLILRSESGQEKAFPAQLFTEESKDLARKIAASPQP